MENKLKEEIKLLNKKILSFEEKNKKDLNSGNISLHNHSNSNFLKNSSSLTSYRDDKNSNIHSIKNSSQSNRKNCSSSFSTSSSIDKIEKYLKNKISNKNISKSKKNNNQILNYENIKKEKLLNENIFLSNKNNDFLAKLLMNETNISISNQKKKNHNRHRSLENSNKLLKKKHSAIFKEILMNSTNESKLNKKNSNKNINHSSKNFNKKNGCFEMVNNINIYTNTLKQDNNNIFYKPNSNSYNSNQYGIKNHYK